MCRIMLPYSFYAQRVSSFTTNSLNLISSISWWKWNGPFIPRCHSHEWWILVFVKVLRGIKILCVLFWFEQELTTVNSVVCVPSFWNINPLTFETVKWHYRKLSFTYVREVKMISRNEGSVAYNAAERDGKGVCLPCSELHVSTIFIIKRHFKSHHKTLLKKTKKKMKQYFAVYYNILRFSVTVLGWQVY